jgi:polyisoprenoid-binding protein YceI
VFSKLTSKSLYLVLLLIVLGLAACGGSAQPAASAKPVEEAPATATPAEEPAATATPTEEAAATATPVEELAATAIPVEEAQATATPAEEPVATPTPKEEMGDAADAISGSHTYVIVPKESQAFYIVDEEFFQGALAKLGIEAGLTDTVGSTQEIEGELQLNLDDLASPLGTNHFVVNLTSLITEQSRRDNWIRENGPRFNAYPLAEFTATAIEDAPDTYFEGEDVRFKLLGELTIREITQPVTFDVTASLEGDTITGVATAQLLMTDFGIEPPNFANTLTVENEFQVRVQFTAKEQ